MITIGLIFLILFAVWVLICDVFNMSEAVAWVGYEWPMLATVGLDVVAIIVPILILIYDK